MVMVVMTEIVIALLMIVNGEIIEHRIQESMSNCLKGKRIAMRESKKLPARDKTSEQLLDDEISELRETLKYAAIVGERLDGEK